MVDPDHDEVAVSPAGLRAAMAVRDQFEVRIAIAVGEFDALGLGDEDCGLSTDAWLRHHTKADHKTAARLKALGRRLHRYPVLREAALAGQLSAGQLQIVTACVPERHFDRFGDHEAVVVAELTRLGIEGTLILMRSWLAKADAVDEPEPDGDGPNRLYHATTLDGRGEVSASLAPERSANLAAALDIAESDDPSVPKPQRRADALDDIVRFFLDNHDDRNRKRRHRPHLNIVTTIDDFVAGLAAQVLETGQVISRIETEVLRCDCNLHRVLVGADGALLDYGRATREWAPDLYNAIALRDRGCRYPGCDRPPSWADVHHVREWDRDQGPTSIDNGVMLCRRHHRRLHRRDGTHAKLLPDGTFELTHPTGRVESTSPRGPVSDQLWDDRRRRTDGS